MLSAGSRRGPLINQPWELPGKRLSAQIAKLTEEAEVAQADYERLLSVYESSTGLEKMRLFSRLTSLQMRRDETLYALAAAVRLQK